MVLLITKFIQLKTHNANFSRYEKLVMWSFLLQATMNNDSNLCVMCNQDLVSNKAVDNLVSSCDILGRIFTKY